MERATAMLKARRDAMERALREHFPDGATWTTPAGGYFYWVELPEALDTGALLAAAAERGVPYVKGADFSCSGGGRLVAAAGLQRRAAGEIGEGVARLGELLAESLEPAAV